MANYVNIGLVEAKALGAQGPKFVRLDASVFTGDDANGIMAYLASEDALLLNPNINYKTIREDCEKLGNSRYWSSSSWNQPLHHEVGHAVHYHNRPLCYLALKRAEKMNPRVVKLIEQEVSGYATENPLDFVAEVYAGMRAGKKYSDKIMRMYRAYGGI